MTVRKKVEGRKYQAFVSSVLEPKLCTRRLPTGPHLFLCNMESLVECICLKKGVLSLIWCDRAQRRSQFPSPNAQGLTESASIRDA